MNSLQDVIGGWKARPLNSIASALLAFALSLLIGGGLWMLDQAEAKTDELLKSWPNDQCTLLLRSGTDPALVRNLEARLPADSWMAFEIQNRTAWITGTLPDGFFQGQGSTLTPELIQRGEAVVLLQPSLATEQHPGDLYLDQARAYRIYGIGRFNLPVEKIIPRRARDLQPPRPEQFIIRRPASTIQPLIQDLLQNKDLRLVDHQQKQQQARAGFQKLRRILSGIALATALLVALLLQALYQAEIRERKGEFALRRSLGARPRDIRNQLLLEALLGSAFPILIGFLLFATKLSFATLTQAFLLTLGWILLCATLPAHQAASLSPGEALKGE